MAMDNSQLQQSVDGEFLDNPPAPPIPGIEPGMKIANFELKKMLGRGGMGEVWLAYQPAMDRNVAIKLLSPMYVQDDNFVKRFLKEAKLSGKLEHPNIITAHDAGIDNGIYYLAMSFVDGDDLGHIIKQDRFIKEHEALEIGKKIAEALQYAWDNFKILHRDIKPSNIMLDAKSSPKLMDMGISKAITEESSMTMTGAIVGTPHYISPEQARGEEDMDFRADIYSLGATLYNILTGDVPFKSMTTLGVLSKLISEPLPPPKVMNPQLSDGCAMLVEIMMAKDRNERQASWQEVIDDINEVLNNGYPLTPLPADAIDHYQNVNIQPGGIVKPPALSKSVILALVSCFLVIIVAVAVLFVAVKRKKMKEKLAAAQTQVTKPDITPPPRTTPIPQPDIQPTTHKQTQKTTEPTLTPPVKTTISKQPQPSTEDQQKNLLEQQAKELWDLAQNYSNQALNGKGSYDLAIRQFETVKAKYKGTTYHMQADGKIEELRRGKDKAIRNIKEILDKKAKRYIDKGDFTKAAAVYDNYSSVFAEEISSFRTDSSEACTKAPEKFSGLKQSIFQQLLATKAPNQIEFSPEKNRELANLETFFHNDITQIKTYVKKINKTYNTSEKNLKTLTNKQVTVTYHKNGTISNKKINVTDVIFNKFTGLDESNKEYTFKATDLSYDDLAKLCKDVDKSLLYTILGIANYQNKHFQTARQYFSRSSFFTKQFLQQCKFAEEKEAEFNLKSAMLKAGLQINRVSKMDIAHALSSKLLKKKQAETLIKDLNNFSALYRHTDLAANNQEAINLLRNSAHECINRSNVFGDDYENVEKSTTKAVDEVLTIFDKDFEKMDTKK